MTDLPDFKPKKLEMVKVETFEADDSGVMVNSDDIIYYINYDGGPFYLTFDNVYGHFVCTPDGYKQLNLEPFDPDKWGTYLKYKEVWNKISVCI